MMNLIGRMLKRNESTETSSASVDDTHMIIEGIEDHGPLRMVREAIKRQQYTDASEILAEVVRNDNENAEAWYLYGWLAAKIGRFDKSTTYLKRADKLGHPKAARALKRLGKQIPETQQ